MFPSGTPPLYAINETIIEAPLFQETSFAPSNSWLRAWVWAYKMPNKYPKFHKNQWRRIFDKSYGFKSTSIVSFQWYIMDDVKLWNRKFRAFLLCFKKFRGEKNPKKNIKVQVKKLCKNILRLSKHFNDINSYLVHTT